MKRAKRKTAFNLNGRGKRRLRKILRAVAKGYGPGNWARTPCEMRDARRLSEAGLVVAAISKYRFWGKTPIKELALYPSLTEALKYYYRHSIMPSKL